MKIWKSYAGEHSAKLKIVASFKSEDDAVKAADCINDLIDVKDKTAGKNDFFSDELMSVFEKHHFHSFGEDEAQQLDYFNTMEPQGSKIIVETDELEIQALVKVFINYGAKLEIYSKHDYKQ